MQVYLRWVHSRCKPQQHMGQRELVPSLEAAQKHMQDTSGHMLACPYIHTYCISSSLVTTTTTTSGSGGGGVFSVTIIVTIIIAFVTVLCLYQNRQVPT